MDFCIVIRKTAAPHTYWRTHSSHPLFLSSCCCCCCCCLCVVALFVSQWSLVNFPMWIMKFVNTIWCKLMMFVLYPTALLPLICRQYSKYGVSVYCTSSVTIRNAVKYRLIRRHFRGPINNVMCRWWSHIKLHIPLPIAHTYHSLWLNHSQYKYRYIHINNTNTLWKGSLNKHSFNLFCAHAAAAYIAGSTQSSPIWPNVWKANDRFAPEVFPGISESPTLI